MALSFKEAVGQGYIGNQSTTPIQPTPVKQEEPGWFQPGSKSEAFTRGFANAATLGLAPKISAGIRTLTTGENFNDLNREYVDADKAAADAHPGVSLAGNLVGAAPSLAKAAAGPILGQVAKNAAAGGLAGYGSNIDPRNIASDVATGAALSGGLSAVAPLAVGAVKKGINSVANNVGRRIEELYGDLYSNNPTVRNKAETLLEASPAQLKRAGLTAKEQVGALKEIATNPFGKEPLGLTAADIKEAIQPIVKDMTPSWGSVGKEGLKAVSVPAVAAGIGAGTTAAVNDSGLDPVTAATMAGSVAAPFAAKGFASRLGSSIGNRVYMSNLPERMVDIGERFPNLLGVGNTIFSQGVARDLSDKFGLSSSPFGKLSDYLRGLQSTDDTSLRQHMMDLQSTPEGRSKTNDNTK